jgi:hypothetical protein
MATDSALAPATPMAQVGKLAPEEEREVTSDGLRFEQRFWGQKILGSGLAFLQKRFWGQVLFFSGKWET